MAAGVAEHSTYRDRPVRPAAAHAGPAASMSSSAPVPRPRPPSGASTPSIAAVRGHASRRRQRVYALDPEALLWVHATLVDTALRVYGPLRRSALRPPLRRLSRRSRRGRPPARRPRVDHASHDRRAAGLDGRIDRRRRRPRHARGAARSRETVLYPLRVRATRWRGTRRTSSRSRRCLPGCDAITGIGWSPARERGVSGSPRRSAGCCPCCRRPCATRRRLAPRTGAWSGGRRRPPDSGAARHRRTRGARVRGRNAALVAPGTHEVAPSRAACARRAPIDARWMPRPARRQDGAGRSQRAMVERAGSPLPTGRPSTSATKRWWCAPRRAGARARATPRRRPAESRGRDDHVGPRPDLVAGQLADDEAVGRRAGLVRRLDCDRWPATGRSTSRPGQAGPPRPRSSR